MKIKNYVMLSMILIMLLSGCYRNAQVQSHEVGLQLDDGVSIKAVVGPGRYTKSNPFVHWFARMVTINVSNITTTWTDPSLVTKDKQPIGLTLSVTVSRKRDSESVSSLYNRYNNEALNDEALIQLVSSKIPGVAKTISTRYTLDQMLGIAEGDNAVGREVVTQDIFNLLEQEMNHIYVELAAVEIADIAVSNEFLSALNAKAQAQINMEVAQQETKLISERLKQESAQTEIDLEIARRENLVNAELAKAYEQSPELMQLRLMELTADMLDAGDVIIYVPEGANITSVLTQSPVTPVD